MGADYQTIVNFKVVSSHIQKITNVSDNKISSQALSARICVICGRIFRGFLRALGQSES